MVMGGFEENLFYAFEKTGTRQYEEIEQRIRKEVEVNEDRRVSMSTHKRNKK